MNYAISHSMTPEQLNAFGAATLPAYLGLEITGVANGEVAARLDIKPHLLAPNGYLHAGTVVSLADTAAGYACVVNLPEGAQGFTTLESNRTTSARRATAPSPAWPSRPTSGEPPRYGMSRSSTRRAARRSPCFAARK